jgi:hypothetical protein
LPFDLDEYDNHYHHLFFGIMQIKIGWSLQNGSEVMKNMASMDFIPVLF